MYDMLSSFIISQHFSKGAVDLTLLTWQAGNDLLLVQIYVDVIIFAFTNISMCNEFANQITTKFKMSMMGKMSFFLGLQISQSPRGIFINQSKYASEIVKKYAYANADHVGCQDTRRSTSGSAQFLGDKLVRWSSKKQKCIAISSTKAEYISLSGCYALALTPCYSAFLITVDVPEVYMHQFWDSVYKHDTFYIFKIDKRKRFKITLEVFRDIFKICARVQGQDFDALPTDEEIVSFLRDLGHTREIHSLNDVVVDQIHQPWRNFAAVINRSLSRKTTGLDKLRLSRAQILWATPPKKARKFKKPASPKLTIVPASTEEPMGKSKRVKRPAKMSSQSLARGVVIRETPEVPVSKKKENVDVARRKGIELLCDVALKEDA
ncbi:integrase, catalytic region, zinc finger, CCHC-type containing protein [Tanacetum coccineum]|uniref:Integrase, catalytic region, zinc finger, CCHC-type containing protein n=1 Tax=Tanacetum coccineum TaxID=301880 RepID=A0ABQ5DDC9_9ASTR